MDPSGIVKPPVPCPVCGSAPQYRIWGEVGGYGLKMLSQKHIFFSASRVEPLICTVCGYVQFFVNPKDFRD